MQQINRMRGAEDLLGPRACSWMRMKQTALEIFSRYGYQPVETPIMEQTALFVHGIGQSSDVVGKEMFSALSPSAMAKLAGSKPLKADETLSLRPEGTAGVVRAALQENLLPLGANPVKLMYAGPMFRAERPQKGRLRQFHQIGVECLGAKEPGADAELIVMLMRFFEALGIPQENMRLLLNSMGDDNCRPAYRERVRDYIVNHEDGLCEECRHRAQTNPLRAFDCKNDDCKKTMAGAPQITDFLCKSCASHYSSVKEYLDAAQIVYEEDSRLVRGLDYYTNTVFEVQVTDGLGSQNAIGGGGRYDKLMQVLGGKDAPGLGFAVGFERIMLALEAAGVKPCEPASTQVYVACVDASCKGQAFKVLMELRDAGIAAEADWQGRSLKSQFKLADKSQARIVVLCGPDEMSLGSVTLRNLDTHEQGCFTFDSVVPECLRQLK